jgi:hypothetical protein
MGMSGRWLCTALLIGCASKGPTDRPVHSPPDTPGPSGTTTPLPTPEELIEELENQGAIPLLDRTTTLGGIDENPANGIRDDIEDYIDVHYAKQINPARQLAAALQASLLVDRTDAKALGDVALQIARAVDCVDRSGFKIKNKPDDPDILDELQALTANTRMRMIAYMLFNQALDGTLSFPLEGEVVCD